MPTVRDEAACFQFVIDLVYHHCRVRLHDGKQDLIRARLGKRMRHHGFATLGDYVDFLRERADEEEITQVVNALTTNFTQFLREKDHFEFLVKTALQEVLPAGQKRFQVWSAACATGEEPYSLAFYLADQYPASAGWDWRVLATDISTRALDHAAAGVYAADRLESVPAEWRRRYFQRGVGRWEGFYRVKRAIIERVTFQQLNLLGAYPFKGPFEAIFCRNVMIYFDRPTQEELVRHLAQLLVPGGHLMTGHAESLPGLSAGLRCVRPSIYRKD